MSKRDRDYYLARIVAEREAAERATNQGVRRVHLKLAGEYEQKLAEAHNDEPPVNEA